MKMLLKVIKIIFGMSAECEAGNCDDCSGSDCNCSCHEN